MPQINLNPNQDKVLLVDDEIEVTLLVSEVMREQGYVVETAASGIDALQKMDVFSPDIIISDIKMPGMDGFEFCQKVREQSRWQDIPFIFLTAVDNIESIRSSRIAGADEYLVKPYDIIDIILAVQTKLDRIRSLRGKYKEEFENIKQLPRTVSTRLQSLGEFKNLVFQEFEQAPLDEIRTAQEYFKNPSSQIEKAIRNLLLYFEFKLLSTQSSQSNEMQTVYLLDLQLIANECIEKCRPFIQTKKIGFTAEIDEKNHEFHIPNEYIKYLFREMLENAIISAPNETQIHLTAHGTQKEVLIALRLEGVKDPGSLSNTSGLMMARAITEYYGGKFIIQQGLSDVTEYLITLPR
jgi:two-component system sensor histidine kinase/response regulator